MKFFRKMMLMMTLGAGTLLANDFDVDYTIGAGYRADSLNWSLAHPSGTPDILSELTWEDLRMFQMMAEARVVSCQHIVLRGYADYAIILHGRNQDSDYLESHRNLEFSRTNNNAGKGEAFDLSAGTGYQFTWCYERVKFSPMLGFAYRAQHLRQYDGFQTIGFVFRDESGGAFGALPGPINGLHSNYRARWCGPWFGFDLSYEASCNLTLYCRFEYHLVTFLGTGHWNLRTDFVRDFRHHAQGCGPLYLIGADYSVCGTWLLGWRANYQTLSTLHGIDHTFFAQGVAKTRLNSVNWHSFSTSATLTYSF